MKRVCRFLGALLGLAVIVAASACDSEAPNKAPDSATKTNTAIPTPAQPAAAPEASRAEALKSQLITLPVLDAFFAQEGFAADLKSKLHLTDDQVARLRNIARLETSKLRENNDGEYTASTAAAREDEPRRKRQDGCCRTQQRRHSLQKGC